MWVRVPFYSRAHETIVNIEIRYVISDSDTPGNTRGIVSFVLTARAFRVLGSSFSILAAASLRILALALTLAQTGFAKRVLNNASRQID